LPGVSRAELVARLAEVSHLTYVRQKNRDHGVSLDQLSLQVTDHDRERAEDTVAELERLGVYRGGDGATTPAERVEPVQQPSEREPSSPPQPEDLGRWGEPVTDVWGEPLSSKRRRRAR
jgi:hypothetical protein